MPHQTAQHSSLDQTANSFSHIFCSMTNLAAAWQNHQIGAILVPRWSHSEPKLKPDWDVCSVVSLRKTWWSFGRRNIHIGHSHQVTSGGSMHEYRKGGQQITESRIQEILNWFLLLLLFHHFANLQACLSQMEPIVLKLNVATCCKRPPVVPCTLIQQV